MAAQTKQASCSAIQIRCFVWPEKMSTHHAAKSRHQPAELNQGANALKNTHMSEADFLVFTSGQSEASSTGATYFYVLELRVFWNSASDRQRST